jgi:hypothetical protein
MLVPDPSPNQPIPFVLEVGRVYLGLGIQDATVESSRETLLYMGVYHSFADKPVLARIRPITTPAGVSSLPGGVPGRDQLAATAASAGDEQVGARPARRGRSSVRAARGCLDSFRRRGRLAFHRSKRRSMNAVARSGARARHRPLRQCGRQRHRALRSSRRAILSDGGGSPGARPPATGGSMLSAVGSFDAGHPPRRAHRSATGCRPAAPAATTPPARRRVDPTDDGI